MSKSDYAENKVNELLVGKTAFTLPTAHVALFTVAPDESGGGTEVTGGAYARKATTGADWATSSGGSISNATALSFATASASWGTVVAFALFDAATGGNMLIFGTLTSSKPIGSGDTATFPVGSIIHTED